MYNQLIWACEPTALAAYRNMHLIMGPVDDAERAGLAVRRHGTVAVLPINGMLLPSAPRWATEGGYATSTRKLQAAVNAARADSAVDSLLLLIDSPGGSVTGIDEAAQAIRATAIEKPVIAQVAGQMASAAYYLGSQATVIRAARTDMVGSIGTRLSIWDMSQAFEQAGIEVITFDTGPMKSAGEPGTPITDDHRAYFQSVVDAHQGYFRAAVQQGRGMTDEQYRAVSDGRMWLAEDALALGLIDAIATVEQTLADIPSDTGRRRAAHSRAVLRLQQQQRRAADHA